jgi:hypothetical protein
MLHELAAQLGAVGKSLLDFEQQRFHIGTLGMRALTGLGRLKRGVERHAPIEEGQEPARALDNRVIFLHEGQGLLVKDARIWYHGSKLLEGQ